MLSSGYLILSDGSVFSGQVPYQQNNLLKGEVVFNTGMTGYVESLTDPSYAGQILVFTYPLIGNYGVLSEQTWESDKIHVAGVVMSELCQSWSHPKSIKSLADWLAEQNIPFMTGVDTRALTKHLRVQGTMRGMITKQRELCADLAQSKKILGASFIPKVLIQKPLIYNKQYEKSIILVDCGLKLSILRSLMKLPYRIKRVPHDYNYSKEPYDGVVISNGPGDPMDYKATIRVLRVALRKNKPIFGICLGSQIMALAAGAQTYKLLFGHRGHNQPCKLEISNPKSRVSDKCFITSQNHGYAINEATLPKDWRVTFRNLNDNSIEGIEHKTKPFFSVQFHPEACPGPTDTIWLFKKFHKLL